MQMKQKPVGRSHWHRRGRRRQGTSSVHHFSGRTQSPPPYSTPSAPHHTRPLSTPRRKTFRIDIYVTPGGDRINENFELPTNELTDKQTTLSTRGLTFCPTMKGHIFDIVKDIYLFARKLVFHDRKKAGTPL